MCADPLIQIPFAGGIDESSDPRLLPPGTVVSSTNVVYDQDGQYQVRYGYTMLNQAAPSSIMRLAVFAFELVAITLLGACYSYSPSNASFSQVDTSTPIAVTHAPINNATSSYQSWGSIVLNGYRIVGWIDTIDGCPRAAVYDAATGALVSNTKLSNVSSVNLFVGNVGSVAVIVVADNGAANIRGFAAQTTPLTAWSAGSVISDADYTSTGGVYGCGFLSGRFVIGYEHVAFGGAGNSGVKTRSVNISLAILATVDHALTAGTNTFLAMAVHGTNGESIQAGFVATNSGYAHHTVFLWLNDSTMATTATSVVPSDPTASDGDALAFERLSSTQVVIVVTDGVDTWFGQFTTAGLVGTMSRQFNVECASAPVFVSSLSTAILMLKEEPGFTNGSYYLVDLQTGNTSGVLPQLVAVLAPSLVNIATQALTQRNLPTWMPNGANRLELALPIARDNKGRVGLDLFVADTGATSRYDSASLGRELYLGGSRYDGRQLVENAFAQIPNIGVSNGGGAGHTYQYVTTYAWVDAQGNLEESQPSPIATITSGAPPNVNLTIRTTAVTNKQRVPNNALGSRIYCLVYRTPDLASGDVTFYRVTAEPYPNANINDPTTPSLSLTDTLSDASLTDGTHPVLYTVSGELVHNPPETFTAITSHKQRIWGIGADQRTIWFSQTYSDGTIPAWNNTLQITVDDAGEPLTCLASLYDKLVVFTRSKIFVIYGDGPSVAGTGSDLQSPQRVPSMAGCIDPRSIVNTPMGIMFQSQRGLELLGPDLSVTYIGQPVSTTTASYPNCTSAAFVEANSVVRWTFSKISDAQPSGPGDNGVVVNFDIRRGRWAVHKITWSRLGAGFSAPMQASVVHPTLGYVAANNDVGANAANIYRENTAADANAWTDFGVFVPLSVTTAWIKAGDLQGWQSIRRLRLLANYYDHHDLNVNVAYDYQGVTDSFSYADATIQTFRNGSYEQVEMTPGAGRRCEAIQVTVSINSISGFASGRGAGLIGLAFEVKPQKGGFRKIPAAART